MHSELVAKAMQVYSTLLSISSQQWLNQYSLTLHAAPDTTPWLWLATAQCTLPSLIVALGMGRVATGDVAVSLSLDDAACSIYSAHVIVQLWLEKNYILISI